MSPNNALSQKQAGGQGR